MDTSKIEEIERLSARTRLNILKTFKKLGYGHLGGSFSIIELLSVLYTNHISYDSKNPNWENRDRLVLSKGHAGPGLYSMLANLGFFDVELLDTLNQGGTNLPSHPDRLKTPGIDVTTGSLGQGISVAAGLATGFKLQERKNYVYAIVGDGELNEGQCWEAFQYIAHNKLHNCIVIIDDNKRQLDGATCDIINQFDIKQKMEAFGFETLKVKGDDIVSLDAAISYCKTVDDSAVCIVLDSVKGQGISFFEQLSDNHSVKFNTEEILQATEKAMIQLENISKGDR